MALMKNKKRKPSRQQRKQTAAQETQSINEALKRMSTKMESVDGLFSSLPLSSRTKTGLELAHFVEMTEIQRLALPAALCGRDVMGAAETGSGKTLAFLIPVLERLYMDGWTAQDGLGALILAPTRELAIQIFQVLRRIGVKHSLSAGLVIGGKDLRAERESISRMNILVATPGRLLQHMDQSIGFEWGALRVLVLDEADRILDLGFAKTVDAVISSLPSDRQTLLFSATQTAPVHSLCRLSLSSPVSVMTSSLSSLRSAMDGDKSSTNVPLKTPTKLSQFVMISALPDKIDHLWSFIRQHTQSKIIVFVSSCKQVRFLYETFCRLQPGVPLLHLHGKQKQPRRMSVYAEFCRKPSAALIATDIAARGLDFPAVNWVVQVDCPEDVETYVHRVGRTARHDASGSSLLFLLPTELKMLQTLRTDHQMTIEHLHKQPVGQEKPSKPRLCVAPKLQALCSQDPELKYLGQKSLISYVRSVFLNANKMVFCVDEQPWDDFARAIGLPGAPKLRFIERQSASKNICRDMSLIESSASDLENPKMKETKRPSKAIDRMFKKRNNSVLSSHYNILREDGNDNVPDIDTDDELLKVKRRDAEIDSSEFVVAPPTKLSRRDLLKTKKKHRIKNSQDRSVKLVFDDETGEAREALPFEPEANVDWSDLPAQSASYICETGRTLSAADSADKERIRQARREKKRHVKQKSLKDAIVSHSVQLG